MDEKLILASVDHKWCTNGRLVRDEDGREFPPPPPHRRLQTCQTAHSRHEEATCAQPFSALSRARATLPVVARRTSRGIRSRGSGLRSSPRRARVELQVARPADARARAGDRPTEARKARGKHNASDANIHHEHVRAQGGDEGASPALRFVQRPQEEWQWCHRVRCAARNPRSLDVRSRGRVNTHRHLSRRRRGKRARENPRQHFPRVRRGFDPRRVARNPLAPSPEARQIRYSITTRRCRLSDTPKAVSHPTVPL